MSLSEVWLSLPPPKRPLFSAQEKWQVRSRVKETLVFAGGVMKLEGDCWLALGVALTLGMAVPTLLWQCVGDTLDKNGRVVRVVVQRAS